MISREMRLENLEKTCFKGDSYGYKMVLENNI